MGLYLKRLDYNKIKNQGTGSHDLSDNFKIIIYPFDKYQIKIKLTPANEFIEIIEVKVNKEFLSYKQKLTSQGFIDVNEDYPE